MEKRSSAQGHGSLGRQSLLNTEVEMSISCATQNISEGPFQNSTWGQLRLPLRLNCSSTSPPTAPLNPAPFLALLSHKCWSHEQALIHFQNPTLTSCFPEHPTFKTSKLHLWCEKQGQVWDCGESRQWQERAGRGPSRVLVKKRLFLPIYLSADYDCSNGKKKKSCNCTPVRCAYSSQVYYTLIWN